MVNANNERHWVKFHFRTQQGIRNLSDQEAEAARRGRFSSATFGNCLRADAAYGKGVADALGIAVEELSEI